MEEALVTVAIRGMLPAGEGCAVFLGNEEKVFVIQVSEAMGGALAAILKGVPSARPTSHELLAGVCSGFDIRIESVVITDMKEGTFYARLILEQDLGAERKVVAIDARPSDGLVLAALQGRPIRVAASLFARVEDLSALLDRLERGEGGPGAP